MFGIIVGLGEFMFGKAHNRQNFLPTEAVPFTESSVPGTGR